LVDNVHVAEAFGFGFGFVSLSVCKFLQLASEMYKATYVRAK